MKKHLLKLTLLFVAVLFSASAVQAQALWTTNGTYKISTSGLTPNLYLTINDGSGALEWAAQKDGNHPTQVWHVKDHRTPASAGYVEIWATIPNVGDFTLAVDQSTIADADDKEFTLKVVAGQPVGDANDTNYGFDQFQRRKAKVNAEGLADADGANPAAGNNALFAKPKGGHGGSRYGVVPTAAGEAVLFDGGGIDVLQYHLVEAEVVSVNSFGVDAFSISNPVNNQLTIKGATSKVKEVSIFSVLGNRVLSKSVSNTNGDIKLNVDALSTGLYIVKMIGTNGEKFTRKIIKE
ncbi:MAG: T9SS type A sorting domain-containing protein [Polaribacter sp.]